MKKWPKYRVNSYSNVVGKRYYCVEEKRWFWGPWRFVYRTTQEELDEAIAIKTLLENGHWLLFDIYKPTEICKDLGLRLNP